MNKHFITLMLTLGFITSSVQAADLFSGLAEKAKLSTKKAFSSPFNKAKDGFKKGLEYGKAGIKYGMDKGAALIGAVKAHPVKTAAIVSGALATGTGVTYAVKTIKKSIQTAKETKQALEEAIKKNQGNEEEIAQLKAALNQVKTELANAKRACIVAQADTAKVAVPRTNAARPAARPAVRPVVRRSAVRPAARHNVARNARPAVRPAARQAVRQNVVRRNVAHRNVARNARPAARGCRTCKRK